MDPNATLQEIRHLVNAGASPEAFAVLFVGLDTWLSKGGFLPDEWNQPDRSPLYAIHATYEREMPDGWTQSGQIATFYLHADVHGISTEERAAEIAREILGRGHTPTDEVTFHVTAVRV